MVRSQPTTPQLHISTSVLATVGSPWAHLPLAATLAAALAATLAATLVWLGLWFICQGQGAPPGGCAIRNVGPLQSAEGYRVEARQMDGFHFSVTWFHKESIGILKERGASGSLPTIQKLLTYLELPTSCHRFSFAQEAKWLVAWNSCSSGWIVGFTCLAYINWAKSNHRYL